MVPKSDALVCFGASGDLAYKQIFPALLGLTQAGQLEMPVIGVARTDKKGADCSAPWMLLAAMLFGFSLRIRSGRCRFGGGFLYGGLLLCHKFLS
jgi:hypothetical protein